MTANTVLAFLFFLSLGGVCAAVHLRARRAPQLQRIAAWSVLGLVAFGGWQNTTEPEFAASEVGQNLVVAGFFWLAVALAVREVFLVLVTLVRGRQTDLQHP
jgi:hypothetical protein